MLIIKGVDSKVRAFLRQDIEKKKDDSKFEIQFRK